MGDNIYNLDGTNQTKSQNVVNTQTVTYHIKIENDSTGDDTFTVTGTAGGSGWTITYYDALTGGSNITTLITGGLWSSGVLTSTQYTEIRVEVTSDITILNGTTKDILITAISGSDPGKKDAVEASTTCVSGANLVISAGTSNPAASQELNDTLKLPVLQVNLAVPSGYEAVKVNSVQLTASGSADDSTDISAVWLVLDANSNGISDTGETILAGPATYSTDNGVITMTLSTPQTISVGNSADWLVIYNLAGTASLDETLAVRINANADINAAGATSGLAIVPSGAPVAGNTKTISDVSASTTSGLAPVQVEFTSQFGTGGAVVQYEWDFDYDGLTFRPDFCSDLSGDISFTYEIAGSYTARLRVTYADGTVIYRDIGITVSALPTSPSISGVTTDPFPAMGPAPLIITATVSAAAGSGKIEAYLWDFDGDDRIDMMSIFTNTAPYVYTSAGTYNAMVQVQNSDGLMEEYEFAVTVQAPGSSYPTATITQPAVDPTTINVGENIAFVGEGISQAGGSIVKYEWDFDGDGGYDLGGPEITSTNYTYLKAGEFIARLTVTESNGLTREDTITITVNPQPAPEVEIISPGRWRWRKDGKRTEVKGQITTWVSSLPRQATDTLDVRYRLVGGVLPDELTSPGDDPPELSDPAWKTAALSKSTLAAADGRTIGFITTLDTSTLLDNNWYEIIAVANYSGGTYDSWNADSKEKRVFVKVKSINPEIEESSTQQKTRVKRNRRHRVSKKDEVTVTIPYEGVTTDTDLTLSIPGSVPPSGGLTFIDNYRGITLSGGATLQKPVQVSITYDDEDGDGTVDGTNIPESTLIMYRYDSDDGKWEPLLNQIIESDNDNISAASPGEGTFGIAGKAVQSGGSSGSRHHKPWYRCGSIGLEALALVFIMKLLLARRRRKDSSRKI